MKSLLTRSSKLLRCSFPSQSKRRGISWGPEEKKKGGEGKASAPHQQNPARSPVLDPLALSFLQSLQLLPPCRGWGVGGRPKGRKPWKNTSRRNKRQRVKTPALSAPSEKEPGSPQVTTARSVQLQGSLRAPALGPWPTLPFFQFLPSPPQPFPKGVHTWCSSSSCTSTWGRGKHGCKEQTGAPTHSSLPTSNTAADCRTNRGRPFPHPPLPCSPGASISPLGPFPNTPRYPSPSHLSGFVTGSGLQEPSDQVIQL